MLTGRVCGVRGTWYESDFEDWGGGVLSWVRQHGPAAAVGWLAGAAQGDVSIEYFGYDWGLNRPP